MEDPLMSIYTDKELKAELQRRKLSKKMEKKDPVYIREPVWWRIVNYIVMWLTGIGLIIWAPVWGTFWIGAKLYQKDIEERKERALKNGQDWYKYHPKEQKNDFKN
jgi:hypothetical protein